MRYTALKTNVYFPHDPKENSDDIQMIKKTIQIINDRRSWHGITSVLTMSNMSSGPKPNLSSGPNPTCPPAQNR